MKLNFKKTTKTVDSILGTFTTALKELAALSQAELEVAAAEREHAKQLENSAYKREHEANRAKQAIENISKLIPGSGETNGANYVVIKDKGENNGDNA